MKAFTYTFILCFASCLWSCESRRDVDSTEATAATSEDTETIEVRKTGETAEEELENFRGWLNEQTAKGDESIRKEWPGIKGELRERNQKLEENFENLSEKSKQEYRELQNRYSRWEERQERRQQQPLNQDKVQEWQGTLLGEHKQISTIDPTDMREAYLTFMGTVRAKRRSWTQNEWDYVDNVYSSLNERRRQVEDQLTTGDKLKIRTLQAEYLALEGSADANSMVRDVK
ncbi:hypothetical protein [Pontibacter rugosus]|uniref:Uncharacterized protein n=1 Tax=Pontibacter rugosus TaxID=1745966 RepID=A0ABW3SW44_9BACT